MLFILWVYYTAIVFLLGGVVAETWELRKMQQRQRAIIWGDATLALQSSTPTIGARPWPGLYSWCLRSEGRRRVNRVRTSPVAALSDARCRFGVPEALFFLASRPPSMPSLSPAATVPSALPTSWSRTTSRPCSAAPWPGAGWATATCSPVPAASARPPPRASSPWRSTAPTATPSGEPCGECENCLRIWNGSANLDVVEIDAASNRGVDDARDLRERAMYAASREGHHKVYIVDEAHMLTREAWNALLKILEEPPPGVVFVFATTEPQKIAAAAAPVLSRLQRFDFRRIGPGRHPGPAARRCSTPRGSRRTTTR